MRDWQKEAPAWIADATKDLAATATLKERRAALRKVGGQFHGGTSWGKKTWSKHCRRHLEQHGLPPRPALGRSLGSLAGEAGATARWDRERALHAKLAAPDITFPFRLAP